MRKSERLTAGWSRNPEKAGGVWCPTGKGKGLGSPSWESRHLRRRQDEQGRQDHGSAGGATVPTSRHVAPTRKLVVIGRTETAEPREPSLRRSSGRRPLTHLC